MECNHCHGKGWTGGVVKGEYRRIYCYVCKGTGSIEDVKCCETCKYFLDCPDYDPAFEGIPDCYVRDQGEKDK